jgi:hypothetical protein
MVINSGIAQSYCRNEWNKDRWFFSLKRKSRDLCKIASRSCIFNFTWSRFMLFKLPWRSLARFCLKPITRYHTPTDIRYYRLDSSWFTIPKIKTQMVLAVCSSRVIFYDAESSNPAAYTYRCTDSPGYRVLGLFGIEIVLLQRDGGVRVQTSFIHIYGTLHNH